MNLADSQRVASALERLGYHAVDDASAADVIVLNTCVVRQSAEDKAVGRLTSLLPLKRARPELVINLMGCMVGAAGGGQALRQAFPDVDVFSPPSDPRPLVQFLAQRDGKELDRQETDQRHNLQDNVSPGLRADEPALLLPRAQRGQVTAFVPVVYGCSHACTFCIIPFRRGIERSRPLGEVVAEVRTLAAQGIREVTLLGQIVDRYGKDVPGGPTLVTLLRAVHDVDGIERIRFLTSHPNYMTDELLHTVADLPKVCEHIEVPVQAGDDLVLQNMKRGYTGAEYRALVDRIRRTIPDASIATDIIVGFPGESEAQFQQTYNLLEELRLDVAHLARYSPRPGTVAQRRMIDDVPEDEKASRLQRLEELQARVVAEINAAYRDRMVDVLVEGEHKGKWKGRTRTNKLVFFEDNASDRTGQLMKVRVTQTGPWSMQAIPAALVV